MLMTQFMVNPVNQMVEQTGKLFQSGKFYTGVAYLAATAAIIVFPQFGATIASVGTVVLAISNSWEAVSDIKQDESSEGNQVLTQATEDYDVIDQEYLYFDETEFY